MKGPSWWITTTLNPVGWLIRAPIPNVVEITGYPINNWWTFAIIDLTNTFWVTISQLQFAFTSKREEYNFTQLTMGHLNNLNIIHSLCRQELNSIQFFLGLQDDITLVRFIGSTYLGHTITHKGTQKRDGPSSHT